MGFCTPEEYERFLRQCPVFEEQLIEDGLLLRKYWFSVSDQEQERRFRSRMEDVGGQSVRPVAESGGHHPPHTLRGASGNASHHPDLLMRLARFELEEGHPEQAVGPARRLIASNP